MSAGLGTITLIGSGELSGAMSKVHRAILARLAPEARAVFVDTPAGFELNADEISAKAVEYFARRLSSPLEVVSFKSRNRASAREVETALRCLRRANYIFAGPGSPSYAIRNWRGSAVWDTIVARFMQGAHLVFASAASIGMGCCALPVYEIYKAGAEIEWMDGLDLLGPLGLKLAIIPHWNNAEGGSYDSRYCFMGAPRLKILEDKLAFDVVMMGIDEQTVCTLEPTNQICSVSGAGGVTLRYRGAEKIFQAGANFSFAELRAVSFTASDGEPGAACVTPPVEQNLAPAPQILTTQLYLAQLARAMQESGETRVQRELIDHAHDTMHELATEWRAVDQLTAGEDIAPLVEVLIQIRAQLRAAKQFALADQVRQQLSAQGIDLEDMAEGTRWKRVAQ